MPEAGQNLSHYRLIEKIGEGGMGVVWKAEDTTLDREVAIKLLPLAFAEDAERLARFEREAKLLAALSHTNIAAIHGLHQDGSVRFLAMEYVAGEDLAARISRGALPVDDAIEIARQIVAGLAAAHDKGVIHRDLKPANVRLMPDGTVKILDFGLAKALVSEASGEYTDSTQSPTVTSLGSTVAGVILGTAAYMSPEQARGKPVDRRADLWAFGCVLYEMLTGKSPFHGETIPDTLGAVMRAEPDWSSLPTDVSSHVRHLLQRCTRKDPRKRLRDAHDAGVVLDDAASVELREDDDGAIRPPARSWIGWSVAAVLALALAVVSFGVRSGPDRGDTRGRRQLTIPVPPGTHVRDLAISRDGRRLAMLLLTDSRPGMPELHVRNLDDGTIRKLDIGNLRIPVWQALPVGFSPDGRSVAFTADRKVWTILTEGGRPSVLFESATGISWPTWGHDDTIVIGGVRGMLRIPSAGGDPQVLAGWDAGGDMPEAYFAPQWFGDALHFAVLRDGELSNERMDLATGSRSPGWEFPPGKEHEYVDGRLWWVRDETLFAAALDPMEAVRELKGEPIANPVGDFAVSEEGTIVYSPPRGSESAVHVWVDREGNETPIPGMPFIGFPHIAPDGKRIAGMGDRGLVVYDTARGVLTTLRPEPGTLGYAVWTPDGNSLIATVVRAGALDLCRIRADGSGNVVRLTNDQGGRGAGRVPFSASRDGRRVVYWHTDSLDASHNDLWLFSEGEDPRPLVEGPGRELSADLSPDGRWLAYGSSTSGEYEVFVIAVEGEGRWKIGEGQAPRWSPDGSELFFRRPGQLLAVSVEVVDDTLQLGQAATILSGPYLLRGEEGDWAVHPDGTRFLMPRLQQEETGSGSQELTVILNWNQSVE